MKKFITAITLFTAGTALADAASLVAQWDSFDFGDTKSAKATWGSNRDLAVTANGSSGTTTADALLKVVGNGTYANETQVDLSSVSGSLSSGFTFAITISGFSSRSGNLVAMFGDESNSGSGIGTGRSSDSWIVNTGSWGKSGSVAASDAATLVLTWDGSALTLYATDSAGSTTLSLSETVSSTSVITTTLALGSFVKGSNSGVGTFSVSQMALYSGVLETDKITSGAVYYIPEPSAFGLLAGAGALALVAARRRRRAK